MAGLGVEKPEFQIGEEDMGEGSFFKLSFLKIATFPSSMRGADIGMKLIRITVVELHT